jgi:two-component system nitrogen regulation response regulator NtrX
MAEQILIIDDEPGILSTLSGVLKDEGYRVETAGSGHDATRFLSRSLPALVLLDIWMPGLDGLEVLKKIKEQHPSLTVIMMSGHGSIETAVRAIKLGAYDYIEKPISLEKVTLLVQHALREQHLEQENLKLREQIDRKYRIVGESPAIKRLRELIRMAGPSNSRVLISGENGTGKELVARTVHLQSPRREGPFVEINCAAIPESLIESELFGHERGAFTGANTLKRGRFELADGGTLFLDEIGDMSLPTQAKVLRALQEQEFNRVGGNEQIRVDVRVIAASNKNLPDEIKKGSFREDLFYRLNVIPLQVPPLRERREDIPLLISHFIEELSLEQGLKAKELSPEAMEILKRYPWPGNIRELKNIVERLMIMIPGPRVEAADIPAFLESQDIPDGPLHSSGSLREARNAFERRFILERLQANRYNIQKTAEELQIERTYLYRKLKYLGIEPKGEADADR